MTSTATILSNPLRSAAGELVREGGGGEVLAFHRRLPGYDPTPLVAAPALASALGLDALLVKNESNWLGLPAFKDARRGRGPHTGR